MTMCIQDVEYVVKIAVLHGLTRDSRNEHDMRHGLQTCGVNIGLAMAGTIPSTCALMPLPQGASKVDADEVGDSF